MISRDYRTTVQAPGMMRLLALLAALSFVFCMMLSNGVQPAWADDQPDPFAQGAETSLADGEYTADIVFAGGSGKATIASPALVTVKGGHAAITVVWSSSNYDYMKIDGIKYLPITTEGGSTFQVPVLAFDEEFAIIGDTTAMSQAHEIEYALTVPSAMTAGAPAAAASSASAASASGSANSASASSASASASSASASSGASQQKSKDSGFPVDMTAIAAVVVAAVILGFLGVRKKGKK